MNRNGFWLAGKRLALVIALLMISSLVLAACGDDEEDEDPTSTTGSGAGAATATTGGTGSATNTAGTSASTPTTGMAEATATTGTTGDSTATTGGSGAMAGEPEYDSLSGEVNADGSSTVAPIAQAVAEEFNGVAGDVEVTVGTSGTGGGFEAFCAGDTDIANASRGIEDDEIAACEAAGIEYTELHIATDALTVVVNAENDWVDCMTVEELNMLWMPESTVQTWADVNPEWPDEEINLYGPGTDSGTFDYFTEEINGEGGASRSDYTASEDDNTLVQGVAGDENALGYFGYSYYQENQDTLKALQIDGGSGCVAPSPETAIDGTYTPLSRPLYVYVNNEALARPEVYGFVYFMLTEGPALVEEVGYVALEDADYEADLSVIAAFGPAQ